MLEEDKVLITTRLEEKTNEIHLLSLHQGDMENYLNSANLEIATL